MILDGIGLMGDGGHTVNETADLATLPSQTKRAALVLYRFTTVAARRPRGLPLPVGVSPPLVCLAVVGCRW